jgi:hypothetical protein
VLETFETERNGERVSMFTGCLPAAPELGLGLRFGVGLEIGFGDGFGEDLGVSDLAFAGVVD